MQKICRKINETCYILLLKLKKNKEEISELQKNDKVKDLKIAATNFSTRYR